MEVKQRYYPLVSPLSYKNINILSFVAGMLRGLVSVNIFWWLYFLNIKKSTKSWRTFSGMCKFIVEESPCCCTHNCTIFREHRLPVLLSREPYCSFLLSLF